MTVNQCFIIVKLYKPCFFGRSRVNTLVTLPYCNHIFFKTPWLNFLRGGSGFNFADVCHTLSRVNRIPVETGRTVAELRTKLLRTRLHAHDFSTHLRFQPEDL